MTPSMLLPLSLQTMQTPCPKNDQNSSPLVEVPAIVLNPSHLVRKHGESIMDRMLWGAAYSSYLYDFLKQLQWDESSNSHTQWVDLLIGFKLVSALHTPVPVIPKV